MATDTNTTDATAELDSPTDALSLLARDSTTMASWSDEKKKDYVTLFKKRANASRYILRNTARIIASTTKEKQFLGVPRYNALVEECNNFQGDEVIESRPHHDRNNHEQWATAFDRTRSDLDGMAQDRASALIKQLPSMNAAMQILDMETFEKMQRRDTLREQGQNLVDEFQELSVDIKLSELDQNMTIGQLLASQKELEAKRAAILKQLDEISTEGQRLEREINKALFKGMPGIGDEIAAVVKELYQQSRDLGVTTRDIENTVLYGDCREALHILESFKTDERKVTSAVGQRFQASLEALKLRVAKTPKKAKKALPPSPAEQGE